LMGRVGNIVKGGQSRIVLGKDDIMEREASVGMYKQYCTKRRRAHIATSVFATTD